MKVAAIVSAAPHVVLRTGCRRANKTRKHNSLSVRAGAVSVPMRRLPSPKRSPTRKPNLKPAAVLVAVGASLGLDDRAVEVYNAASASSPPAQPRRSARLLDLTGDDAVEVCSVVYSYLKYDRFFLILIVWPLLILPTLPSLWRRMSKHLDFLLCRVSFCRGMANSSVPGGARALECERRWPRLPAPLPALWAA